MNYFTGEWYADCMILTEYIKEIRWYGGASDKRKKLGKLGKYNNSMLYGLTFRNPPNIIKTKDPITGKFFTLCRTENPHLMDVYREFGSLYFSDFVFTQVQMNRNWKCGKHIDGKNVGESILVVLGEHIGGDTAVYYDGLNEPPIFENGKIAPIKFDGSKYYHECMPFEGERFSLVFFNTKL